MASLGLMHHTQNIQSTARVGGLGGVGARGRKKLRNSLPWSLPGLSPFRNCSALRGISQAGGILQLWNQPIASASPWQRLPHPNPSRILLQAPPPEQNSTAPSHLSGHSDFLRQFGEPGFYILHAGLTLTLLRVSKRDLALSVLVKTLEVTQ